MKKSLLTFKSIIKEVSARNPEIYKEVSPLDWMDAVAIAPLMGLWTAGIIAGLSID